MHFRFSDPRFLHVEDVANGFVELLNSDIIGPVNISSGKGTPIFDIAKIIGIKLNRFELINFGGIPITLKIPY